MDFRKIANEASGFFSRAKQYTEETFLKAEKTELDAHFENLLERADKTEEHTKKLLSCIEGYLQPNPTVRMEDVFYEKLELKKDTKARANNLEHLGQAMLDAGNEFGPSTPYGGALLKVAQTELKIGASEHEFLNATAANTLVPIRRFLEGDMKTIQKERKVLHGRRLDLDACKSKLRKAKTVEAQATAEADLRVAQAEFDKQVEITKLLLEGIQTAHNNQLKCLRDFVDAQMSFYAQCHQHMADLQRELSGSSSNSSAELISVPNGGGSGGFTKQARAIMDYAPMSSTEIELRANEVVIIYDFPGLETDYVMVEKMGRKRKVPVTYLEEI
ncbi:Endophilin-B1 [Aphelenchoides fujianensis]|nr:Endophilin-B1 [Aphelenchoides fujianensis]